MAGYRDIVCRRIGAAVPRLCGRNTRCRSQRGRNSEDSGLSVSPGMVAAAVRPAVPSLSAMVKLPTGVLSDGEGELPGLIVVCPEITDPQNLGGILRSAAAFGARAVLVADGCADVFSRRVIRVSMGGVFSVLVGRIDGPNETAIALESVGYALVAAVVDEKLDPVATYRWPARSALVLGAENEGVPREWAAVCSSTVTIPMSGAVDSLNVGVAAGICMHSYFSFAKHGF